MMKTGCGASLVDYKDYYQTLGVAKNASAQEIKKAYRKLVRKYHPDVNQARDADKKTQEINEAYAVLGAADKRAAYDALGSDVRAGQPFHPPPEWGARYDAGGGAEDFFADLFAHVGRRGFAMRGQDIHASMVVDLHDAYHGARRSISLRLTQTGGERMLEVHIPKGVLPGQQLRLVGQGQPGSGGALPGDLLLEMQFRPDPRYRIEGANVLETLSVAPWEAALGAHIDVVTPSGQLQVSVPAGSQTGRKLRLKGRGIPAHRPGDLYLVLEVVLPPASSDRARELYRAMARELAFNPRSGAGA
jgi:curved DNA-binding protein